MDQRALIVQCIEADSLIAATDAFEALIDSYDSRIYRLHQWSHAVTVIPGHGTLVTVMAVFAYAGE